MSVLTRTTALVAAGALLAVPTTLLVGSPASADTERQGPCGTGAYELNVDRERGGFEIDSSLDNVPPGSQWRVVLKQDGKRFAKVTRTADNEGDIDVDRFRADTAGSDVFTFKAKQIGEPVTCAASIAL